MFHRFTTPLFPASSERGLFFNTLYSLGKIQAGKFLEKNASGSFGAIIEGRSFADDELPLNSYTGDNLRRFISSSLQVPINSSSLITDISIDLIGRHLFLNILYFIGYISLSIHE